MKDDPTMPMINGLQCYSKRDFPPSCIRCTRWLLNRIETPLSTSTWISYQLFLCVCVCVRYCCSLCWQLGPNSLDLVHKKKNWMFIFFIYLFDFFLLEMGCAAHLHNWRSLSASNKRRDGFQLGWVQRNSDVIEAKPRHWRRFFMLTSFIHCKCLSY